MPGDHRGPLVANRGGNQIDTIGVGDYGVHQVAVRAPVGGDQTNVAVDLWSLMSSATDDLSICLLDEHLDLVADPILGSLVDQLVGQISHPGTPGLDLLRRMPPIEPERLRAFLG